MMEFLNFEKKIVEKFWCFIIENLLFIFDVDVVCKDFDIIFKWFFGYK